MSLSSYKKKLQKLLPKAVFDFIFSCYLIVIVHRNSYYLELKYWFLNRYSKNMGITKTKREVPIVVSLTSFPARIDTLYLTIETILRQTEKPDFIELWLSKPEFPNLKQGLPPKLLAQQQRGLTIKFCEQNLRMYNKLLFALRANPDANIVTVDDDAFYRPQLIAKLYRNHLKYPKQIITQRGHKIDLEHITKYSHWHLDYPEVESSYLIFATGVGGVLYPPNSMDTEVFNQKALLELSPHNDDIWFKAMSLLKQTKCRTIATGLEKIHTIYRSQKVALIAVNDIDDHSKSNEQAKKVFARYNIEPLLQELVK